LEWLGEELGEREWSSRRYLFHGRQQQEEEVKGYKYPLLLKELLGFLAGKVGSVGSLQSRLGSPGHLGRLTR
jgi:hypothetical protein